MSHLPRLFRTQTNLPLAQRVIIRIRPRRRWIKVQSRQCAVVIRIENRVAAGSVSCPSVIECHLPSRSEMVVPWCGGEEGGEAFAVRCPFLIVYKLGHDKGDSGGKRKERKRSASEDSCGKIVAETTHANSRILRVQTESRQRRPRFRLLSVLMPFLWLTKGRSGRFRGAR